VALCCHSNEICALIANPPNSAQLRGTPYHSPKLHPGPCSSVGMRPRTDRQTRITNIHFASSTIRGKCNNDDVVLTEASLMGQTSKSGQPANADCFCQPCRLCWLNRPSFDALNGLVQTWTDLHVCLPVGKILVWLTDRITSWQAKANSELTASNDQLAQNKNAGNSV